jgi:glucose/arabinose dehydrogenase
MQSLMQLILAAAILCSVACAQTPVVRLVPVASGLARPVFVAFAPGDSRMFVLEQAGKIRTVQDGRLQPESFLDITALVGCCGERGLLGLAFHPQYAQNRLFFVNYTNKSGNTVIAKYRASGVADPDSEILLTIDQPYSNHNGGMVAFGPDGFLYIGMGDGGAGGDPQNYAQNLDSLLGKILRIDVNGREANKPYAIPKDNPFIGKGRPEIWSYGWRNPWRFSFDQQTKDLWVADVGQNAWEEVHLQPSGKGGGNYGWKILEGSRCFVANCNKEGLILPVIEYSHREGQSITGGYRYRGSAIPALSGAYIYADFASGRIWAANENKQRCSPNSRCIDGSSWSSKELLRAGNISSFGEDPKGELYAVDYSGTVYRLSP